MAKERLFTKDFMLDTSLSMCCSLNYFVLLINMVGFAASAFGATTTECGMAAGLYVIGGLVSRIFLGKYVELVGRRRMLLLGLAAALLMSGTYFLVSSLLMLYAIRFLHGMFYGIISTCTGDIIAKIVPASRRGEGIGYFYLSVTAAMAVGPFLGLELGATGDYRLVFSVGIVMYALALLFAVFMRIPEETLSEEQRREARSFSLRNLIQPSAVPLAATCMVFYFSYSGVLSFISSYAQEVGMMQAATYFYLTVAAGTFVSRMTTGKIYDTKGPNIVMIPGYLAFCVGMLVFSQTSSTVLFLAAGFVMGYGISIIYAVCQAVVVSKSPAHRYGVTTATFAGLTDLGTGMGPTVLGFMLSFMGFRDMYLACVLIALASLGMYWAIHGRKAVGGVA